MMITGEIRRINQNLQSRESATEPDKRPPSHLSSVVDSFPLPPTSIGGNQHRLNSSGSKVRRSDSIAHLENKLEMLDKTCRPFFVKSAIPKISSQCISPDEIAINTTSAINLKKTMRSFPVSIGFGEHLERKKSKRKPLLPPIMIPPRGSSRNQENSYLDKVSYFSDFFDFESRKNGVYDMKKYFGFDKNPEDGLSYVQLSNYINKKDPPLDEADKHIKFIVKIFSEKLDVEGKTYSKFIEFKLKEKVKEEGLSQNSINQVLLLFRNNYMKFDITDDELKEMQKKINVGNGFYI